MTSGLLLAGSADSIPESELGNPFLRNYDYRTYQGHPQNWAVLQAADGRMLFGNSDGLLEYDGARWRLIQVANSSIVRSLAEHSGTVYVGAVGELGYLHTDPTGASTYVSLTDELPAEERRFGDVWQIWPVEDGVIFWTVGKLFRWRKDHFSVRDFQSYRVPAWIDGRVYNNEPGEGLQVLRGEDFETVLGGELLAGFQVFRMLSYDRDTLLISTRDGRLFLFSSPSIDEASPASSTEPELVPFETEVAEELRRHGPYGVTSLSDGGLAIGTRSGGMFVVEADGSLRFRLDRASGLRDDSVWAAGVDREGGLWLALNRGLARAEVSSPLTAFGESSGLVGTVESVSRHAGTLVAATGAGAFGFDNGRFRKLDGFGSPPCWSALSTGPELLLGCNAGIYRFDQGRGRRIRETLNAFVLFASPSRPDRIYSGESQGLGVLRFENGFWRDGGHIAGVGERIRSIAEDADGRLWLGTQYRGVLRLDRSPETGIRTTDEGAVEIHRFGVEDGLPLLEGIKVHRLEDKMIFGTTNGIYHFDEATQRFETDPDFRESTARTHILRLAAAGAGRLWLSRVRLGPALATRGEDGTWGLDQTLFRRLPGNSFYALYPQPSGLAWIGGVEGLFRYDPEAALPQDAGFSVSLIASNADGRLRNEAGVSLPFTENRLVFQFAAQSFHDEDETTYSYRLDGFDDDWSPWLTETRKEYTNLKEGRYWFRVRARNVYGTESKAAPRSFVIRPPWYRTWPAYLGYLAAAALLITAAGGLRAQHLKRDKRQLELEIATRTHELQESENKLRMALEGARMAPWVWNMRADRVTGWEKVAEVLGVDLADYGDTSRAYRKIVHPEDGERFDDIMATAANDGGEYEFEHRILRPDGSAGWILGKGRVICDDSGRASTMSGIVYDISERKQAEIDLAVKHEELERFTYSVSHDLKSPLVTIGGFLGLLEEDIEKGAHERVRRDLDQISTAVDKMARLLEELLELSRVGRLVNPPEVVPLAELVDEARQMTAAARQDVELKVDTELPEVWGDRTRLLQVFQNLLENAFKFSGGQETSRVEVGADSKAGRILCWVADNGIGIEASYHDKIFELFQRLDSDVQGSGVGLALVKRIVEHHGGRIWVESEGRGKGSTFYFTLPAVPLAARSGPGAGDTPALPT